MGNIVGGLIGGVGSLLGGQSAKSNDLTGYNYLSGQRGNIGPGVVGYNKTGVAANDMEAQLLGAAPVTDATKTAFGNYLGSTGYNFTKQQGMGTISGSAAAHGNLNSGGTLKALQKYGSGLANQTFGNYLGQLSNLGQQGLTAAGQIGEAGTSGGKAAGDAMQSGTTNAFGQFAGLAANALAFI